MELSSSALPYWSELGLEPICGRQNVQTLILYQRRIRMSEAKTFFRSVALAYAVSLVFFWAAKITYTRSAP
jgi:hypothetical protein